jgi:glycosyltransferase involved in cell wall biosynthesis
MTLFPNKKLAVLCFAFRGRREKFIVLQEQMFGKENIRVFAKEEGGYDNIQYWETPRDICKLLEEFEPDVVHAYVDRTVLAAISLELKFPTVIDMHDCAKYRGQKDPFISWVYGHKESPKIFASPGLANYVKNHYNIEDYHVIMNLPLKRWLNFKQKKKLPGNNIVYFGGLASLNGKHSYRYYEKIFQKFVENGINVHVYPANPDITTENLGWKGCIVHETIDGYENLYSELSQYQAGFAGYNDIDADPKILEYPQACIPNKAFDYMMAGIPTVAYNLGYSSKYVRNWGVCVNDIGDLPNAYYKAKTIEIDYKHWQKTFVLDNYYDELAGVYDELLKRTNPRKIPAGISLCMIVRNEEKNLARCLDSVMDFVDEIIIVDTGSEDDTIGIAKKYNARIYKQSWKYDFSYHRNHALSYATCPWIIVLDADETLELKNDYDIHQMKINLNRLPDDIKGLTVTIRDIDNVGNQRILQKMVKIFRKGYAHYEGIVHNKIVISGDVTHSDIVINHTGHDDNSVESKYARSLMLLKKRIKLNCRDYDAHYYLANLLFEMGGEEYNYQEGIRQAKLCISYLPSNHPSPETHYFSLYYSMGMAYCKIAEFQNTIELKINCLEQAINVVRNGLEIYPDDPDLNFAMTLIGAYLSATFGRIYMSKVNGQVKFGWRPLMTTGNQYREIAKGLAAMSCLATGQYEVGNKIINGEEVR